MNLKKLAVTALFLAPIPGLASSSIEINLADLAGETAENLEKLGSVLSRTLSASQNCPADQRAKLDFGTQITSVREVSDRPGETYTIEAVGYRPMPSGKKYSIVISIQAKIQPSKGPVSAHTPLKRNYSCTTTIQ